MRLSTLFTRTSREVPSDETSRNAQLLIRAGFVHKTMAGVYSYLPLGLRVLNKIENIVRKHMDSIGGQEVLMNSLHPKIWWDTTDRWDPEKVDVLFRLESQTGSQYALACSHEEQVTPIVRDYVKSYKDLPDCEIDDLGNYHYPISVYQIQTKFRDELRSKSGLLRGREFRMKDMYDFHTNQKSADTYYDLVKETYLKIYSELGLEAYAVHASGGMFTQNDSHEFQVPCQAGEDEIYISQDGSQIFNSEVAPCLDDSVDYTQEDEKSVENHELHGIIGVESLVKHFGIDVTRSTKTMMFEDNNGKMVVAAVRSDRNISLEKLQKVAGRSLKLASAETVKKFTGAEIGYAGIINLPESSEIYLDDSLSKLKNFETGTNKTGYHSINVCFGRDLPHPEKFYDIKVARSGDKNPADNLPWRVEVSAEVGNIFKLGDKYTKAFNLTFNDENNKPQTPIMNCHGIGTSRCMGVIAEIYSDDKGLKWPESVAPFKIHLITHLDKTDEDANARISNLANEIYNGEVENFDNGNQAISIEPGEVLWDDRQGISIGEKFADADLIGCPFQVVISKRSLESGGVEIKIRS